MSKPPPESRRGRRKNEILPDEDVDLWSHVARQVTPPRRMKQRVRAAGDASGDPEGVMLLPPVPERPMSGKANGRSLPEPSPRTSRKSPPLTDLEPKQRRRIAKGRTEIDARLDLHGMRQDEAHAALSRFLIACQLRGDRIVLVITGKGAPALRERDIGVSSERERGVLRRNVPRWLSEPDLRVIVVSYSEAHARHGGDGAIYVHLRALGR